MSEAALAFRLTYMSISEEIETHCKRGRLFLLTAADIRTTPIRDNELFMPHGTSIDFSMMVGITQQKNCLAVNCKPTSTILF
jgi:hypothetical protein